MTKKSIEKIVKEEFKKLGRRKDKKLEITKDYVTDSYYINYKAKHVEISIDLLLYKHQMNWAYVWIDESLRGKGIGRKIVGIGEGIAKKLDLKEGYILSNSNQPFWDHMGYYDDTKKYDISKSARK